MNTPRDPNASRNPDQLIRAFLDEGPMDLREQVYDEVRSEVDLTEQRTTFGPWRNLMATRFVGFAAVTAVVAAAVIVGLSLSGGGPFIGGAPTISPSVQPSVAPSEAPASVEPSAAADLPVGIAFELMLPDVPVPNADLITVTIPGPGWYGEPGGLSLTKDLGADGRATVTVLPPEWFHVPTDICRWQSTTNTIPGTAAELVAALAAQTYETPDGSLTREPSTPVDITIDGDTGQSITLVVPTSQSSDPGDCDAGRPFPADGGISSPRFCSLVDRDNYACWLPHLEPGYLDTLWVMGSGDSPPWVIDASFSPTASSELHAEVDAIVDSISTSNVPPFGQE
jgi:hypothetical protein